MAINLLASKTKTFSTHLEEEDSQDNKEGWVDSSPSLKIYLALKDNKKNKSIINPST